MLDVTHVPSGKRAFHCPWMLVDSDRSMIAGREVLGFPKKLGAFSFAVDGVELSSAFRGNETKPLKSPFRAGATVAATVSRGGVTLLDASGAEKHEGVLRRNRNRTRRVSQRADQPPDSRFRDGPRRRRRRFPA